MVYATILSDEADAFIEVVHQWATTTVDPLTVELDRHAVDVEVLRGPMDDLGLLSLGRAEADQPAADAALVLRAIDAVASRSAAAALLIVAAHAAPANAPDVAMVEALGTEPIQALPRDDGGVELTGTAPLVTLAGSANRLGVIAELDGQARLWELDAGRHGVMWRSGAPRSGLRGCPGATMTLDRAAARALASPDAVTTARRWWTVGTAMAAIGTARRALREAGGYLGDRRQFGQPLAELPELDRIIRQHGARLAADQALLCEAATGWTAGQPLANGSAIAVAATQCTGDALNCVVDAVQLHGGYGYIDEYPVERCFRDVQSLRAITAGWADALRRESK